jgi:hypothetical protein
MYERAESSRLKAEGIVLKNKINKNFISSIILGLTLWLLFL